MANIKKIAGIILVLIIGLSIGCSIRELKKGEYLKCPSCGYDFKYEGGAK